MPFDGIVTKCVVEELKENLIGGRIDKIFQPEKDEVLINIRCKGKNFKLLLSANPSYPRIHLTMISKENPISPPMFCMLLRKHLGGGRISGVDFFDFERIVGINIESTNELGDTTCKKLIIEIMGKHSNVILVNSENKIIDAIKHIDFDISSKREVMPARTYDLPPTQGKTSILNLDIKKFVSDINLVDDIPLEKYILNNIKGFSPLICREICHKVGIDRDKSIKLLDHKKQEDLQNLLIEIAETISQNKFCPCIILEQKKTPLPLDFYAIPITQYSVLKFMPSISEALDFFYTEKDKLVYLHQRKQDLIRILKNSIDRCQKKIIIHQSKLKDVSERDNLKLFGELILANIHSVPLRSDKISLINYYSNDSELVEIPLNPNLTPSENSQRYYRMYQKAKNAFLNVTKQLDDSMKELSYLESVSFLLEHCSELHEIDDIRTELIEQGYLKSTKHACKKKNTQTHFMHYISSDNFDIYVGKNNTQNDYLTLKIAKTNDLWLHTKDIPGSHVVVRCGNKNISDSAIEEASMLAAYYSKARFSSNVPVDYTYAKNVHKPSGAKPGMVIYKNHKTINVTPDIERITVSKI